MKPGWVWFLLLVLTLLCSCREDVNNLHLHQRMPHDAYIWQRRWTPTVMTAVQQSADLVRAWRVLVAQSDERGYLQPVTVEWTALEQSKRPVILVVRIEGQLIHWDEDALLRDISALLSPQHHYPTPIAGVEIDHDCGAARLSAYARF